MSLEIRNAPGQPGYALLVFNRDLDAGSLRLAIQNRMSRKYLGPSVGKANWSPARSHLFDVSLVSRSDGETIFKIGPEAASFIPDETSVEFTSEDNTIREHAIWSGILPPFFPPGSDTNPENFAEAQREDLQGRPREHRAAGIGAGRGVGIEPSPPEYAVPAPKPGAEQAMSRNALPVETSDEKLDQLIAAFAGELETEAVMDSAESKARSFHDDQAGANTDAHGLVGETVQIIQTLSSAEADARARRRRSATDWLPLLLALGFLYLGIKVTSPDSNAGLFFMVVGGLCGLWWIGTLKVASNNPANQPVLPSMGERTAVAVKDSIQSKARPFHDAQIGVKTDIRNAADGVSDAEVSDAQARRAESAMNWLLILLAFGFLFLSLVLGGPAGLFSMLAAGLCGGCWLWMKVSSNNRSDDKSS